MQDTAPETKPCPGCGLPVERKPEWDDKHWARITHHDADCFNGRKLRRKEKQDEPRKR